MNTKINQFSPVRIPLLFDQSTPNQIHKQSNSNQLYHTIMLNQQPQIHSKSKIQYSNKPNIHNYKPNFMSLSDRRNQNYYCPSDLILKLKKQLNDLDSPQKANKSKVKKQQNQKQDKNMSNGNNKIKDTLLIMQNIKSVTLQPIKNKREEVNSFDYYLQQFNKSKNNRTSKGFYLHHKNPVRLFKLQRKDPPYQQQNHNILLKKNQITYRKHSEIKNKSSNNKTIKLKNSNLINLDTYIHTHRRKLGSFFNPQPLKPHKIRQNKKSSKFILEDIKQRLQTKQFGVNFIEKDDKINKSLSKIIYKSGNKNGMTLGQLNLDRNNKELENISFTNKGISKILKKQKIQNGSAKKTFYI